VTTAQVRQNIYAAYLDGDVTAMEALRSLCSDYEELDATYKDFEGLRDQARDQISNVLVKIGDRVDVKGFGVLTLMQPSIVEGFDKKLLTELIIALTLEGNTDVAQRLAACRTKSARAGGLRIEREKAPR
jgi:hypothetical protein